MTDLKRGNRVLSIVMCLLMVMSMLIVSVSPVFAVSEEAAMNGLQSHVQSNMAGKEYELEEGGSLDGDELWEGSPTDGYELNEDKFNDLSDKGQKEAVSDIATYSQDAMEDKGDGNQKVEGVTESTIETWWKQLQTKQGVGSKFMNEILKNTKPDFVSANRIWEPFSGPVSIIMGVIAVAVVALLGVVMAADIAYITLPPVRMFVSDDKDSKGNKIKTSHLFSHDAILAVRTSEESSGGDGESKQALGIYFKRRIFALILLGICLMYLVQGQLYTLVGYILDIVSGFLGF